MLWRIATARSDLWHEQNPALAAAEAEIVRAEIATLVEALSDEARRAAFLDVPEVRRWVRSAGRRRTADTTRPGGLTVREREVAVKTAQGLSNKEIALALGISEKTVEMHVSSCLGKLGFASRTQIAAWIVTQGLLPSPQPQG